MHPHVHLFPPRFRWPRLFCSNLQEQSQRVGQGNVCNWRRLDGFGCRWVFLCGMQDKIGALHCSAANSSTIAIGHQPLGQPCAHVARLLVHDFLHQTGLGLQPLLNLVDSNDKPLVHVVCRIACLRLLCDLSVSHKLVNGHLLVTGSGASSRTMGCFRDGKPVWELDISIAAQASKHRWMISVDVGLVARAPWNANHAALSRTRHVHVLGQVGADQEQPISKPAFTREATFAFARVLSIPAMVEGPPFTTWPSGQMYVVLFPLLELFDILGEVDGFPFLCRARGSFGGLVGRPADHQAAILVLRPLCFDFFQLFLPLMWIAIDHAAHMGRIAAVAPEHLHKPLISQLQQVDQWRELVITLHESLDVHVQSPTLLAFNGTIN